MSSSSSLSSELPLIEGAGEGAPKMSDNNHHQQSNMLGGSTDKRNSGLFLTLPSNFSLSPSSASGSPRNSLGGGGSTPPLLHQQANNKSRLSPSSTLSHHVQHHHTPMHNYTWEDLRRLFLVSLEKMCRLEPEAVPFRQPVDPVALGIPDYADIIRKPMDLQTIRNKMNSGKYNDPFLYVDDVLRMLDNAWVYNREGSKVYNYCTKLSEVFQKEVNPVMYHLGYKRGRSNSFHFNSDTLNCHGRPVCLIYKGNGYWRDAGRDIEFNLCEPCYAVWLSDTVESGGGSEQNNENNVKPSHPDVILNTTSVGGGSKDSLHQLQQTQPTTSFVFTVNKCKSYSPAAELHKSHLRDAEMSRQLVLREFLRMLLGSDTTTDTKQNVFKMLTCNGKLLAEFIEYVRRRRGLVLTDGGGSGSDHHGSCSVVYGESFTTNDLDTLVDKLKGLTVTGSSPGGNRHQNHRGSVDSTRSSGVASVTTESEESNVETAQLVDLNSSSEASSSDSASLFE